MDLQGNSTLISLHMCDLGTEGAKAIAEALKVCGCGCMLRLQTLRGGCFELSSRRRFTCHRHALQLQLAINYVSEQFCEVRNQVSVCVRDDSCGFFTRFATFATGSKSNRTLPLTGRPIFGAGRTCRYPGFWKNGWTACVCSQLATQIEGNDESSVGSIFLVEWR
jgi:hypothetical protein